MSAVASCERRSSRLLCEAHRAPFGPAPFPGPWLSLVNSRVVESLLGAVTLDAVVHDRVVLLHLQRELEDVVVGANEPGAGLEGVHRVFIGP